MKTTWRVLDHGKGSAAFNMALDEHLLDLVGRGESSPVLRFYDWTIPTVSFGYHQKFAQELDYERLQTHGFGYVRRPTGGRALIHRNEVTYAVVAPVAGSLGGNITETYAQISRALAAGLQRLGVPAELEEGHPQESRQPGNPCFTSVSRYELSAAGRKIVGSAQLRRGNALLQHGSIQLHSGQEDMADLVPGMEDPQRERLRAFLSRNSICIDALRGFQTSYETAVRALLEGFMESWPETVWDTTEREWQPLPEDLAESITKYGSDAWNRNES
jgi:lipoyl(octanoyl) transferase